ncbi:hypothetical protein [Erythrobacter sp. EC-HK427]|uniref:hypothetical protein n=1 Tax=Erythrobacter sp. EC-HK427 TaxID=2038396 RepID=UPI00125E9FD5|nr:hypothetical protein [Erythrobacter sp. EC-HK427]
MWVRATLWLYERIWLLLGAAFAIDLVIAFGPPLFSSGTAFRSAVLMSRWLVMAAIIFALASAFKKGLASRRRFVVMGSYAVWAFTAAALANGAFNPSNREPFAVPAASTQTAEETTP